MFRIIAKSQPLLDSLFSVISLFGDKEGVIGNIWLAIHFQNPAHAFSIGLLSSFALVISQTVKSGLREARPFMLSDAVRVNDCKHVEFGNPSSHTFLSAAMMVTFVCLYYREWTYKTMRRQNLVHLFMILNGVFILIYIIGFSRIFKGVHSYN